MSWRVPDGMRGRTDVVRVSAGALDRPPGSCREFAAAKVRPKVWPASYEERRYPPLGTFPLGVVMDAVDATEFDGARPDRAIADAISAARDPLHPGAATWVEHAAHTYLEVSQSLAAEGAAEGVHLEPDPYGRVVQHSADGGAVRMLTAWGRWYTSPDGTVREFRRIRIRRPYGTADDPSTLAMAYTAGHGSRAAEDVFRNGPPVAVRLGEADATRVRVLEVGLTDGTVAVLVDATPPEVRDRYRAQAQPKIVELQRGGGRVPWRDCDGCKVRSACAALPRTPGLLGLAGRGTHRRLWSVTAAQRYRTCPAQHHLREINIPAEDGDAPAARRGRLVHEWLAAAHGRPAAEPCRPEDLPDPSAPDLGLAAELMTRDEYGDVRRYLVRHLSTCPLTDSAQAQAGEVTGLAVEPRVAAYDSDADVIALATPDLTRTVDGVPVWRETKTSAVPRGFDADGALAAYPQIALAVCMLADGAYGGDRAGCVELELLTSVTAEVLTFDPGDPVTVRAARAVLAELASEWHDDTEFRARPGPWCGTCPVSRWCPQRATVDGSTVTVDGVKVELSTGEILHDPGRISAQAQALVSSLADTTPADDEPPF